MKLKTNDKIKVRKVVDYGRFSPEDVFNSQCFLVLALVLTGGLIIFVARNPINPIDVFIAMLFTFMLTVLDFLALYIVIDVFSNKQVYYEVVK